MHDIQFKFQREINTDADVIIIPVFQDKALGDRALEIDADHEGLFTDIVKGDKSFKGKAGDSLFVTVPAGKNSFKKLLILGLGDKSEADYESFEKAGGAIATALTKSCATTVSLVAEENMMPEHICMGFLLRSYYFDKYKNCLKNNVNETSENDTQKEDSNDSCNETKINSVIVSCDNFEREEAKFKRMQNTALGIFFARDLVSEPANKLTPEIYAERVKDELKPLGVNVTVLDKSKIEKLEMGALLGVAQGSDNEPRVVILHWKGNGCAKSEQSQKSPLIFVGKGVTFDTGGISLKPSKDMDLMKYDMAGSAAVAGLIKALALNNSSGEVIGIMGLVENMPSGSAYRPSDVVTSMSGKTIEVLNTDAEGRLVLADCITYAQRMYKPEAVIDIATLTGAALYGLGYEYCGTFSNDDEVWATMEKASKYSGEKLWRMPLDKKFTEEMKGKYGDLKNIGTYGSIAGSCTAAAFLESFVEKGTKWAHLDIAGTAWAYENRSDAEKGARGFGVRTFENFVNSYEFTVNSEE